MISVNLFLWNEDFQKKRVTISGDPVQKKDLTLFGFDGQKFQFKNKR